MRRWSRFAGGGAVTSRPVQKISLRVLEFSPFLIYCDDYCVTMSSIPSHIVFEQCLLSNRHKNVQIKQRTDRIMDFISHIMES